MATLPTVSQIVEALGGNSVVAEEIGVGVTAVSNWRSWNCFPPGHYLALRDLGRKTKTKIPDELFKRKVA